MSRNLGLIGCGKMAYALLQGVKNTSSISFDKIYVNDIDAERSRLFEQEFAACPRNLQDLITASDMVILAVKPQQIGQVLQFTTALWNSDKLILSIAAGIKTSAIENICGSTVPVIRVMPNTPCLLGDGVTAISGGKNASNAHLEVVSQIMNSVGASLLVDEKYMDAITALSGSGPAYVYLVAESMINAGIQVGLDVNTARNLVFRTLSGSLKMLEETGKHPAVLREEVCSPGGTTIAGVKELEENGIRKAFFQAIEKAYQKSIELGKD